MNKNRIKISIVLTVPLAVFLACQSNNTFAEVIEGDGADSQSGVTWHGCDAALTYQNVQQCPSDNGKFGGASWHIFDISKTPVKQDKPTYDDRPVVRTAAIGNGYGRHGTVSDLCKSSDYDYYFAFVYDGWYGYRQWNKKSLIFYGPIDWGTYEQRGDDGTYHHPIYHKGNDHTWTEIKNAVSAGTNVNSWRLKGEGPTNGYGRVSNGEYKSSEALAAWRDWSGDYNAQKIPDETGFFCARTSYKVTVIAKDTDQHDLSKVTGLQTQTYNVKIGQNANLSAPSTNTGFKFKEWRNTSWGYLGNGSSYKFKPTGDVTIYAVYEAFDSTSTLDIKVKNESVSAYNTYHEGNDSDPVYAKPTDKITYHTDYKSSAQLGANFIPQRIQINNDGSKENNNKTLTLEKLYNKHKTSGGNWDNAFVVSSSNLSPSYYRIHSEFANGEEQSGTDENSHTVLNSEVGEKILTEDATTSKSENGVGTTPSRVYIDLDSGLSRGNVITDASDTAKVQVPYNFSNSTEITTAERDENGEPNVVFAGETKKISFDITTSTRLNRVLGSQYATIVRNAHKKMELCYNGECSETDPVEITNGLHANTSIYEASNISETITVTYRTLMPAPKSA